MTMITKLVAVVMTIMSITANPVMAKEVDLTCKITFYNNDDNMKPVNDTIRIVFDEKRLRIYSSHNLWTLNTDTVLRPSRSRPGLFYGETAFLEIKETEYKINPSHSKNFYISAIGINRLDGSVTGVASLKKPDQAALISGYCERTVIRF